LVQYKVPWFDSAVIQRESVDLIFSQAVLEHVDDLKNTYASMNAWLKPGGYLSHQIDFKSHETAPAWNGHWAYSDRMWKMIRGRRPYLINREPFSSHAALLAESGFKIVAMKKIHTESAIPKNRLAPKFRDMPDEDLTTSGAFFQAVKA
jgi:trans-aconitate methyltransferase